VKYIIFIRSITSILIIYNKLLLDNRDLLFKPNYNLNLSYASRVFTYIINIFIKYILISNNIDKDIIILKKVRLGILEEFNNNRYFIINTYYASLTTTS